MEEERLKAILESLLFAAGEPVSLTQLANALDDVAREEIRKALGEMMTAYADGARGIMLDEIAGGYQLRTPREHASYVRRLLAAKPPRLSRPLLETLAIVAYRQPITRPEIEQLRGVDSGGVLETLVERGFIKIAGRKEAPGRPIMYATTPAFLEVFGLKDLDSLPDLEEFRALEGPVDVPAQVEDAYGEGPSEGNSEPVAAESEAESQIIDEAELSASQSDPAAANEDVHAQTEPDSATLETVEVATMVEADVEIESEDSSRTEGESAVPSDTAQAGERPESIHTAADEGIDETGEASAGESNQEGAARRDDGGDSD